MNYKNHTSKVEYVQEVMGGKVFFFSYLFNELSLSQPNLNEAKNTKPVPLFSLSTSTHGEAFNHCAGAVFPDKKGNNLF